MDCTSNGKQITCSSTTSSDNSSPLNANQNNANNVQSMDQMNGAEDNRHSMALIDSTTHSSNSSSQLFADNEAIHSSTQPVNQATKQSPNRESNSFRRDVEMPFNAPTTSMSISSSSNSVSALNFGSSQTTNQVLFNWQASKGSIKDRMSAIFNREVLADVHFLVGKGVQQLRTPAHKFVLSIGSAVFDAMFNGAMATKNDEIDLPDVEPAAFLALLRFLYTDEVQIGPETVMTTPTILIDRCTRCSLGSRRILLDIPCKVCRDHSSGKHYGIFACDGCAGFFKRSIRRNRQYICKARGSSANKCPVDKTHRNQCRACRLNRCVDEGMNKDAVQHERGPRNSTIRRQVALYLKDTSVIDRLSLTSTFMSPPMPVSSAHLTIPTNNSQIRPQTNAEISLASTLASIPRLIDSNSLTLRPTAVCHPTPKYPFPYPNGIGSLNGSLNGFLSSNCETVCETAARLLFYNIKWLKTLPVFVSLPMRDQLLLIEEGWRELFILSAAQFMLPIDMEPLIASAGINSTSLLATSEESAITNASKTDKFVTFMTEIRCFQEIVTKFKEMRVDTTEYTCLKAIVLFKTVFPSSSTTPSTTVHELRDSGSISVAQDRAQLTLNQYISSAYPTQQSFRFGKLLLMLPSLRSVSGNTIEELFFRKTIGNIAIDRLLSDMYKSTEF
ncbi:unnamed protein product [Medioppia subpectinata]|uniref:Nuclear receptor subfamily 2 group E member 1 n=1 Tax=Medioppia subpectinata TaxID=1979941 RepID=A0A7R9PYD8_9ACAR|nr:unnamed protein product [Medioppia subpectinata]CAG2104967.1 unnamed protein product [Medioppia subpectinata]